MSRLLDLGLPASCGPALGWVRRDTREAFQPKRAPSDTSIVGNSPYQFAPRDRFLRRMLLPAAGVFFFGMILMGIFAADPALEARTRAPASPLGAVPAAAAIPLRPWPMAARQLSTFFGGVLHIPEVCISGQTLNTLQDERCAKLWDRLAVSGGLLAIPFGLLLVFVLGGLDSLVGTYRTVHRKIVQADPSFGGVVTDPPDARPDRFAWAFCLRRITVQVGQRRQILVYIPDEMTVPDPGQTVAIYDGGSRFGTKRYFAALHTPNVAIVSAG